MAAVGDVPDLAGLVVAIGAGHDAFPGVEVAVCCEPSWPAFCGDYRAVGKTIMMPGSQLAALISVNGRLKK